MISRMITVTDRDTCKPAYIDANAVQHIEEFQDEIDGKPYPYSRIFIKDDHEGHEYSIDVVESKHRIEGVIEALKA